MNDSGFGGEQHAGVAFTPADLPLGAHLAPIGPEPSEKFRRLLLRVRPDLRFISASSYLGSACYLLATSSSWASDVRKARAQGFHQPLILFPEVTTSYYDYWSFPIELIQQSPSGDLFVRAKDFEGYVAGLGEFFGRSISGGYHPSPVRYRPIERMSSAATSQLTQLADLLGDKESKLNLKVATEADAYSLWRHWLLNLYNGLEYMDYVTLPYGGTVMNCGVHGGGEIPYFLAALGGHGCIINVDPLGNAYLQPDARAALGQFQGRAYEQAVALHNFVTEFLLPVDAGGMAAGGRINDTIPGVTSVQFPATTVDQIVSDLKLDRLDLIKMDIEGAEPLALLGAETAIQRFRPQLAISIYHQPDHYVDIPLKLYRSLQGYELFVKHYHFISNETILYAIPTEQLTRRSRHRISVHLTS